MNRVEEEVERETSTTTTSNTAPTDADTKEFATSDMMAGGFSTGRGKKVTPSEASIHSKLYFRIINSDYV